MINLLFEWLVANQIVFWLLLAIIALLFEMGSPGLFFFLSFFFGALFAAITAVFTFSWLLQSTLFILGSVSAFLVLHYWVKKRSKIFDSNTQTNVYAMRAKKGLVIKAITPEKMGLVKINGQTWSARCAHGTQIEPGQWVTVVQIKGAHLVVKQIKEKSEL